MNRQAPTHYEIIDRQTGFKVGQAKTLRSANSAVDRRDQAYGGYRFTAKPVYAIALAA